MKRPSHKEITKKLVQAKNAVEKNKILYINQSALISDALELGFLFKDDIKKILTELLSAVTPDDYVGGRPPHKSYESKIVGIELFAFKIKSYLLNDIIYFKFAVVNNYFYLVSLHKHRPK